MRNASFGPDGRPRPMGGYQGTQLYGAHGQPLGPVPPQAGSPYSEYAQPSPTSSYNSFTDDRDRLEGSRKRSQQDPHTGILPPPVPGQASYGREGSGPRRPVAPEDDPRLPPITPTTTRTFGPCFIVTNPSATRKPRRRQQRSNVYRKHYQSTTR